MLLKRLPINCLFGIISMYMLLHSNLQADTTLEEIVVIGYKELDIIDREEIKLSGARELGELLQGRAGLNVYHAAGSASKAIIDMRGFGANAGSNTLIVLDGIKLNNSSDLAPPDLSSIDLRTVERIEITQGSNGILYGNQAVGGVINIFTRSPQQLTTQIEAGVGSFDAYALRALVAGRYDITGTNYQANARTTTNTQDRPHSRTERHQAVVRVEQGYAGGRVSLEQQWQREHAQLPGALFAEELAADRHQSAPAYRGDFSTIETLVTNVRLHQTLNEDWNLATNLSFRDNDGRFKLSGRTWTGTPSTQKRQVIQFNPRITGEVPLQWIDLNLTVGSEIETVDYRLKTAFGTQAETQESYAVYTQLSAALTPTWNTTLGLRHAQIQNNIKHSILQDLDDSLTVGSLGLAYEPLPEWRLFANWDQNYRFATVDEHTNVINGQTVGLSNQTGDSYTLGAGYQNSNFKIQVQQYWLELNNEIGFDPSTFYNINLTQTQRRGTLLEIVWLPTKDWRVGSDYTYTNNRITSGPFAHNDIPLVPSHSGRIFLDYAVNPNLDVQFISRWVGKRTLGGDFTNTFKPMPSYSVLDFTARYHSAPWQLTASVENMLDHQYNADGAVGYDAASNLREAYFPATGRSVWLSIIYEK